MGRKPQTSRPSFFKVLIKYDHTTRLRLPHAFVQKLGKFLPERAKLRASCGRTWNVKLEETEDDEKHCCFVGGWSKFVKDLKLKIGEFLVFWFDVGKSTFDVSIYGTNSCERVISAENGLSASVDSDADEDLEFRKPYCHDVPGVSKRRLRSWVPESENKGTDSEIHPRFEVVMTESRKSRMCLPKKFAEAAGLIGKRAVVLEYPPKQRYWAVTLDLRPRPHSTLDMMGSWKDFRKENGLVLGRIYSFEYDPSKNVIRVKALKK